MPVTVRRASESCFSCAVPILQQLTYEDQKAFTQRLSKLKLQPELVPSPKPKRTKPLRSVREYQGKTPRAPLSSRGLSPDEIAVKLAAVEARLGPSKEAPLVRARKAEESGRKLQSRKAMDQEITRRAMSRIHSRELEIRSELITKYQPILDKEIGILLIVILIKPTDEILKMDAYPQRSTQDALIAARRRHYLRRVDTDLEASRVKELDLKLVKSQEKERFKAEQSSFGSSIIPLGGFRSSRPSRRPSLHKTQSHNNAPKAQEKIGPPPKVTTSSPRNLSSPQEPPQTFTVTPGIESSETGPHIQPIFTTNYSNMNNTRGENSRGDSLTPVSLATPTPTTHNSDTRKGSFARDTTGKTIGRTLV